MTQLRWDPVAAPDFTPAMNGVNSAAQLINQALSGAQAGVAKYNGILDDRANKTLIEHMLSYQDPEAFKAALASGALYDGVDRKRLSMESLDAIGRRPGILLNQANSEMQLDESRYDFGRKKDRNAALDAAAPFQQQMLALASNGDLEGARKVFDANRATFDKLGYQDFATTMRDTMGQARDKQSYDFSAENQAQGRWRFGNEQQSYEDQQAALAAIQDIRQHAIDPQSAESYIATQKYSPRVESLIRSQLSGLDGWGAIADDPTLTGFGVPSSGGPADPTRIMNFEARGAGVNAVPGNVQTMGQASDFATGLNNRGIASSAMGLYQIVGQTMRNYAPKVLGPNWRQEGFTPANQDKIAAAIFSDATSPKNTAEAVARIRGQWTSLKQLPDAAVAQLVRMPWEQARQVIAAKESGASAQAMAQAGLGLVKDQAQSGVNNADEFGTLTSDNNAMSFAKTQTDNTPIATVVEGLKKSTFPDAPSDLILSRVREIMARGKRQNVTLTPATAADILATSVRSRGTLDRVADTAKMVLDPLGLFTKRGGLGGNLDANYGQIDELIANAAPKKERNPDGSVTSRNQDVVGQIAVRQANEAQQAQAQLLLTTLQARLARIQASGRNVDTRQLEAQIARAQSMLGGAQSAMRPDLAVPAPVVLPPPPSKASKPTYVPPPLPRNQRPQMVDLQTPGWSVLKR